jgi:hypothetical protein
MGISPRSEQTWDSANLFVQTKEISMSPAHKDDTTSHLAPTPQDFMPWRRRVMTELPHLHEVSAEPYQEPPDDHFMKAIEDPLHNFALALRALPPEHLFRMCDALGDPELDRKLIAWAVAYANGQEVFPPTKGGRRV